MGSREDVCLKIQKITDTDEKIRFNRATSLSQRRGCVAMKMSKTEAVKLAKKCRDASEKYSIPLKKKKKK